METGGPDMAEVKKAMVALFPSVISRIQYDGPLYIERMNDDTIYINGSFTSFDEKNSPTKLKDTVLWRKLDGEWYIERDMFNET